jgi:hypothetical protein
MPFVIAIHSDEQEIHMKIKTKVQGGRPIDEIPPRGCG